MPTIEKNSKWGSSAGPGKDPKQKRLTRTWSKRRVNSDPKPYLKLMAKRGA